MGTVERGVPPNCPDQNGDIPASVHTQSWSALSELLPSLVACHFKILTSWRVTALICLGTRRYAFLQTLLFTLLRIMQRSQALPHFRFSFHSSQMKLWVRKNVQKLNNFLKCSWVSSSRQGACSPKFYNQFFSLYIPNESLKLLGSHPLIYWIIHAIKLKGRLPLQPGLKILSSQHANCTSFCQSQHIARCSLHSQSLSSFSISRRPRSALLGTCTPALASANALHPLLMST